MYVGVLYYGERIDARSPRVEIKVVPGAYLRDVQDMLVKGGVLTHPRLFRWVAVVTGKDRKVQAGRYVFLRGMSISRMLHKLSQAEFEVTRLTIPEGLMLREIATVVQRQVEIDPTQFYETVCDEDFIRQLGISAPTLEGYLFPDTYLLSWPMSSRELAKLMVERFREVYDKEIARYASGVGLSTTEIVTLASIIQAEAQDESEMNRISAVYQNRMRQGLRLEADPTVAYALGGARRALHYSDLKVGSPYNTYRNKGLPPGPICSPGLASLLAAVRPLEGCDDLYFVAAGDGTHLFSKTHDEHMKAKKYAKSLRDAVLHEQALEKASEKALEQAPEETPGGAPEQAPESMPTKGAAQPQGEG